MLTCVVFPLESPNCEYMCGLFHHCLIAVQWDWLSLFGVALFRVVLLSRCVVSCLTCVSHSQSLVFKGSTIRKHFGKNAAHVRGRGVVPCDLGVPRPLLDYSSRQSKVYYLNDPIPPLTLLPNRWGLLQNIHFGTDEIHSRRTTSNNLICFLGLLQNNDSSNPNILLSRPLRPHLGSLGCRASDLEINLEEATPLESAPPGWPSSHRASLPSGSHPPKKRGPGGDPKNRGGGAKNRGGGGEISRILFEHKAVG